MLKYVGTHSLYSSDAIADEQEKMKFILVKLGCQPNSAIKMQNPRVVKIGTYALQSESAGATNRLVDACDERR